jgi:hypothetical protein
MTFLNSSLEMNVMPHLSVVALSSRASLQPTGCFDFPIVGRLRFWARSGALGVLLFVLRREEFSPLGSVVEL